MNKQKPPSAYVALIEKMEQIDRDIREVKDKLLQLKDQFIDNKEIDCHTDPDATGLQNAVQPQVDPHLLALPKEGEN
jgi:hypothetical protein